MFAAEKICAIFNATVLLGFYPEFNSFIFNENVKDFQNVHGKYWELREYNLTTIQNDDKIFVAGVSVTISKKLQIKFAIVLCVNKKIPEFYGSDKNYQTTLWDVACSVLGVKYRAVQLNSNLINTFYAKEVDVIMLTHAPESYEVFLNPFVKTA